MADGASCSIEDDTPLGPSAFTLSDGERQRLAIVRSLLRQSAVLVIDEATSALDALTEPDVFSAIATNCDRLAVIVISHRLNALAGVDRFMLLDRGRIVAVGRHEEMYRQIPLYRSLYNASAKSALQPRREKRALPVP
jgi:ABC-type multidrug transport system fused ATPase/permease subunit